MDRRYLFLLAVAGSLALPSIAVAGPTLSTDAVPGVNFSAYKTYSWANSLPPAGMDPVLYQRITSGIEGGLSQQGYQKAATGDISLILTIGAQNKTDVESWGRFGLQTSVYQYTEGQLSLDAFDTSTKQALWHGQVSETVNPEKPNTKAIDEGIVKLMAKFPATAAAATN